MATITRYQGWVLWRYEVARCVARQLIHLTIDWHLSAALLLFLSAVRVGVFSGAADAAAVAALPRGRRGGFVALC